MIDEPPPLPCSRAQSTTPSSDVASEANEDELASKLTHIAYRHPSVRTLSHGPKELKDKIKNGDRTIVGYNTEKVYTDMRSSPNARASSTSILVDTSV